jgi:uncharacterized membrane protein (GlpM family)
LFWGAKARLSEQRKVDANSTGGAAHRLQATQNCRERWVTMSLTDLLFRFVLGATFVSVFAAVGCAFKPKTFAGIFGSAPTIALASLSLAFRQHSPHHVERLAQSMLAGATALCVYSLCCVLLVKGCNLPVWLLAALAWTAWGLTASALFFGLDL